MRKLQALGLSGCLLAGCTDAELDNEAASVVQAPSESFATAWQTQVTVDASKANTFTFSNYATSDIMNALADGDSVICTFAQGLAYSSGVATASLAVVTAGCAGGTLVTTLGTTTAACVVPAGGTLISGAITLIAGATALVVCSRGGKRLPQSREKVDVGRDPGTGECNECPDASDLWFEESGGHHPCPGLHRHVFGYNRDGNCTCWADEIRVDCIDGGGGMPVPPAVPATCDQGVKKGGFACKCDWGQRGDACASTSDGGQKAYKCDNPGGVNTGLNGDDNTTDMWDDSYACGPLHDAQGNPILDAQKHPIPTFCYGDGNGSAYCKAH